MVGRTLVQSASGPLTLGGDPSGFKGYITNNPPDNEHELDQGKLPVDHCDLRSARRVMLSFFLWFGRSCLRFFPDLLNSFAPRSARKEELLAVEMFHE
jgi:hypothetical protein